MATLKQKMGELMGFMRGNGPARYDVARYDVTDAGDPQRRDVTIAQLKQGYTEVVDTMQALRTHLDETQKRQAQMARMMEGLPEVIKTLPEATRTQTQLFKAIGAHLESQNTTNGHLTDAINGMSKSSNRQDQTLGQISSHLIDEAGTRRELNVGVLALNSTLEGVEASNLAAREAHAQALEQSIRSEERLATLYRKGQRFNAVMLLLSALMALAAVGVVVWLLQQEGKLNFTGW